MTKKPPQPLTISNPAHPNGIGRVAFSSFLRSPGDNDSWAP
jgi:hypothetical protein